MNKLLSLTMYEDIESGQTSEAENARKEVRWSIPVPVVVRGTSPDGTAFEEEGTTEDVSPSGMAIFLPAHVKKGARIEISTQDGIFTSAAVVTAAHTMGPNFHRVRVRFEAPKKYERGAAPRKYIYDASASSWSGYIEDGIYYNRKHEAFGKVDGVKIISIETHQELFVRKGDSFYDPRMHFMGRVI